MKTMKFNKIISICLFLSSMFVTACSQDDDIIATKGKSEIRFLITDTGVQSSASTRAVTDAEYRTTFENGKDKVSLFAVKDNKVIEGFDNICLTYQDGTWAASTAITYTEALEGATFYAVYPYNNTYSLSLPIEENPETPQDIFEGIVEQWDIDTNQAGEEYTKYDLMTGSGTASKDGRNYTVNLQLEHRMAMIAVGFPYLTYNFTNPDLDSYSIASSEVTFNLTQGENTASITPYYDETTGKYRLLVKPNSKYTLAGEFAFRGELYTYSFQNETGAEEKKYTPHTVRVRPNESEEAVSGITINNFSLAIGDYFCADGSLINATDIQEEQKSNVIGVIYFVGNPQPSVLNSEYIDTDILKQEKPNCTHGLVLALDNANSEATNFAKLKSQYTAYTGSVAKETFLGFNNTRLAENTENNKGCEIFMETLLTYRTQNQTPDMSTGWYLPSIKEFVEIYNHYSTISSSMATLSKSLPQYTYINSKENADSNQFYWSSTETSDYMTLISDLNGSNTSNNYRVHKMEETGSGSYRGKGFYRFALAF